MTKSKHATKKAPAKKPSKPAKYIQSPAQPGFTKPTPSLEPPQKPLTSEQARKQLRGW
jgi:hypothetical protein